MKRPILETDDKIPRASPRAGAGASMPVWKFIALIAIVLIAHIALLARASATFSSENATPPHQVWATRLLPPPAAPAAHRPQASAPARKPALTPPSARKPASTPPPATLEPPESPIASAAPAPEPVPDAAPHFTPAPGEAAAPASQAAPPALPAPDPAPLAHPAPPDTPAPPPAAPVQVPGSVRLLYNASGQSHGLTYHARGELVWRQDGARYDARFEVSAFLIGSRSQSSTGSISPQGLAPERFADKLRSEVAAHFEHDRARVVFSANTPDAVLQPGAQDRLSAFFQLAALLAADPARYPAGSTIMMQVVGPRDADDWAFTIAGEERLMLPIGETLAWKLTRAPRREHDTRVDIWLAPALGWVPARLRLTQSNGDFVDLQLRATEPP